MTPTPRKTNRSPIAERRLAIGMTQQQLAEKVGCYAKDISRWENGVYRLRADMLGKIASALDCTIDDLIK